MQFPIGVFGVSMAQATLPRVSAQWAQKDPSGALRTLERSLVQTFAINLPAAAGLAFLADPIIRLIFEHGRFSSVDTHQTGLALAAYSVGLAAYSGVKVLVPAFYAFGNARVPVISSILSVGLTLAFNLVSVRFLGFWGLALGTSVAAYGNLVFLIVSLRRRAREVLPDQRELWSLRRLGARFGVHGALALTMGALCAFTQQGLSRLFSENLHFSGVFGQSLSISVLALEGLGVLLLLSWVFGVEETREVLGLVRSRILNRIQKKRS
jgi:putative peptidoglycan lipid II flippase